MEQNLNPTHPAPDALADLAPELMIEDVSAGMRLVHLIVDNIAFFILYYGAWFIMLFVAGPERILDMAQHFWMNYFISLATYFLFMFLMEGISKGRTLGKLISGSRAVKVDGSFITWKDAFLRTIIRFVPFEPLSILGGSFWHDKWSHTRVAKIFKR